MIAAAEYYDVTVDGQESTLGRWTTAHWSPQATSSLRGTVERIWYFDGAMTHRRERVFPDATAELIVMLDERHRDGDSATLEPFPAVCINGLRTRPAVVVAPGGRCRVLGIRFTPLGANALLRSEMTGLVDVTVDLRSALGRGAEELGERCNDAAGHVASNGTRRAVAIVRTAARWTAQRVGAVALDDALVGWAIQTIRDARGSIALHDLSARLGVSRSQFASRFRTRTGLGPKRFARIVRFRSAISLLADSDNIVAVAADLGYYDQPHMYRDFMEFAQMTPGAFLAAKRYPASASLAEA